MALTLMVTSLMVNPPLVMTLIRTWTCSEQLARLNELRLGVLENSLCEVRVGGRVR